jgi:hypothetical protein
VSKVDCARNVRQELLLSLTAHLMNLVCCKQLYMSVEFMQWTHGVRGNWLLLLLLLLLGNV